MSKTAHSYYISSKDSQEYTTWYCRQFLFDFNGDSRTDIMCMISSSYRLWFSLQENNVTEPTKLRDISTICLYGWSLFGFGHFNNDKMLDAFCKSSNLREMPSLLPVYTIAYQSEKVDFNLLPQLVTLDECKSSQFIADFNGDGYSDVMCYDDASTKPIQYLLIYFRNVTDPERFTKRQFKYSFSWCNYPVMQLRFSDFNGDGRADIMCRKPFGDFRIAINDFPSEDIYGKVTNWFSYCPYRRHIVGDFNGDLKDDILCNSKGHANKVSLNVTNIKVKAEQKTVFLPTTVILKGAKFQWRRNGSLIDIVLPKYELSSNKRLKINELEESDSGMYRIDYDFYGFILYDMVFLEVTAKVPVASGNLALVIILSVMSFLVLAMVIIIVWYRKRLLKQHAPFLVPNKLFKLDAAKSLFEQSSDLPYDMAFEFPRTKINIQQLLGEGEFAQVWLSNTEGIEKLNPRKSRKHFNKSSILQTMAAKIWSSKRKSTSVAVKRLKENASESDYKDLATELKVLIHIGEHVNIVNLLGSCTLKGELLVILEYCEHGALLEFIRSRRKTFKEQWTKNNDIRLLNLHDLVDMSFQIANGMQFLQSRQLVHRDLAARNILVAAKRIVKISDFGLARNVFENDAYLKETNGVVPVKWMAPESLFHNVYTTKSDVWSIGILLWELYSLGWNPYPGLQNEMIPKYIKSGNRMSKPEHCPQSIYALMKSCWRKDPKDRPQFADLVTALEEIMKSNEKDFSGNINLNNIYGIPSTETAKNAIMDKIKKHAYKNESYDNDDYKETLADMKNKDVEIFPKGANGSFKNTENEVDGYIINTLINTSSVEAIDPCIQQNQYSEDQGSMNDLNENEDMNSNDPNGYLLMIPGIDEVNSENRDEPIVDGGYLLMDPVKEGIEAHDIPQKEKLNNQDSNSSGTYLMLSKSYNLEEDKF